MSFDEILIFDLTARRGVYFNFVGYNNDIVGLQVRSGTSWIFWNLCDWRRVF